MTNPKPRCTRPIGKKQATAPDFITFDTGVVCTVLGAQSYICGLLDALFDNLYDRLLPDFSDILSLKFFQGFAITKKIQYALVILETVQEIQNATALVSAGGRILEPGEIDTESFCRRVPTLKDYTNAEILTAVAKALSPFLRDDSDLREIVANIWIYNNWSEYCECDNAPPPGSGKGNFPGGFFEPGGGSFPPPPPGGAGTCSGGAGENYLTQFDKMQTYNAASSGWYSRFLSVEPSPPSNGIICESTILSVSERDIGAQPDVEVDENIYFLPETPKTYYVNDINYGWTPSISEEDRRNLIITRCDQSFDVMWTDECGYCGCKAQFPTYNFEVTKLLRIVCRDVLTGNIISDGIVGATKSFTFYYPETPGIVLCFINQGCLNNRFWRDNWDVSCRKNQAICKCKIKMLDIEVSKAIACGEDPKKVILSVEDLTGICDSEKVDIQLFDECDTDKIDKTITVPKVPLSYL